MVKIVENALVIYTDGSLDWTGRKGGYGIVVVHIDDVGNETVLSTHAPIGVRGTTNNRMELKACIEALKMAPDIDVYNSTDRVVIRTDSMYVVRNNSYALSFWPKNKWKNKDGRPIDNTDLWREFARAYPKIRKKVVIEWVKGHGKGKQKDPYNDAADKLATESAQNPLSRHEYRESVRRKKSENRARKGCVDIHGQIMDAYIIGAQWMKEHRIWKYRYQVASKDNPDYDALDWIYSTIHLRDGHTYKVRVNDNMGNPQILELIDEVIATKPEIAE